MDDYCQMQDIVRWMTNVIQDLQLCVMGVLEDLSSPPPSPPPSSPPPPSYDQIFRYRPAQPTMPLSLDAPPFFPRLVSSARVSFSAPLPAPVVPPPPLPHFFIPTCGPNKGRYQYRKKADKINMHLWTEESFAIAREMVGNKKGRIARLETTRALWDVYNAATKKMYARPDTLWVVI